MKLYIQTHPTGELREVLIDPADYDALLALGYPDASQWRVGATTGRVNLACPFTQKNIPVAMLLKHLNEGDVVELVDGDNLNLRRTNLRVVTGVPNAHARTARKGLRRAFAGLQTRIAA